MRILIAAGVTPTVGGVSSHINSLGRALRTTGHEAVVVTPLGVSDEFKAIGQSESRALTALLRLPGVMIGAYFCSQILLFCRLRSALRVAPSDVIHAQDVSAANAALHLPQRIRPPVVLTVHGYVTSEAVADGKIRNGSLSERILLRQEKQAYQGVERIVTVDRRLAQHATGLGAEPDRILTLPNFVDTIRFYPLQDSRSERAKLGLRDDEFVVLCARRLVAKNGVEHLVRAMPVILRQPIGRRLRVLFAGAGQQEAYLRSLTASLDVANHATFLGQVPNEQTPCLYAAADAVVIPSVTVSGVQEATSISAIEAMACGKPVIASAIGGLMEIIQHEVTGLLVPEGDPDTLAEALIRLSRDPSLARQMGESAEDYVRSFHSMQRATAVFVGAYSGLLGSIQ